MLKRKTESGEKKKKIRREAEESVAPLEIAAPTSASRPVYTNRQRILLIASRGINARYRHLLEDLKKLLPHHKKDNKLDAKNNIQAINEIAEMNSCNQVLYLECRKKQDLYLHLARTPNGPSVKFHVVNIHTMDELKLTGNAMIGSRPLLNFDKNFDGSPQMMLIKSLLSEAFGTPNGHPKSKPFVDRVMCFYLLKNKICESSTLRPSSSPLCLCLSLSLSLPSLSFFRDPKLPNLRSLRQTRWEGHSPRRDRTSHGPHPHQNIQRLLRWGDLIPEPGLRVSQ
jgi:hypothetical protein